MASQGMIKRKSFPLNHSCVNRLISLFLTLYLFLLIVGFGQELLHL